MTDGTRLSRRTVLKGSLAGLAMTPAWGRFAHAQSKTTTVNLQLGWLANNNQLGEACAKNLGYYEEEGINLVIQPGGPNIDGVAVVASGRHEIGQVSSSPSLMLAASQKIPVKCIAVGVQEHPYAYFSLPKNPVRTPQDLVGKKVGIQATARVLLNALLKKHNISEKDLQIVVIGSDMSPLLTGQVDVVSGWVTNTTSLKPLGPERIDLRLWDAGVRLYALPYYSTQSLIEKKPDMLAGFLRATAKGWAYAHANTEKAIDFLIKDYPNLIRADELEASQTFLKFAFNGATKANGWGTFDKSLWQEQISLYDELKQFAAGAPKVDDVVTTAILERTADARPKIG